MEILSSQFAAFASENLFLALLIVYGATIFLGNIGAFVSLWVAFRGSFGPFGVLFVLCAGLAANLTGDVLWYAMGRGLRTTGLGRWIKRRTARHHKKLESHIEQKGRRWMIFGKFAYGSNFPVIFMTGWIQLPFRAFFRRALLAVALWIPVILGVSYSLYAGLSPLATPLAGIATIQHFELLFLAGLVAFIILQYVLARIVRRFFDRNGEIID